MQHDQQAQRQAWVEGLAQLRAQGALSDADETTLIRHMDERLAGVEEELKGLVPEYEQRAERDGREAADAWLGAQAREMGEREGADARRMVESLTSIQIES